MMAHKSVVPYLETHKLDSFDGAVTTLLLGSAHFLDAYRCGVAGLDVLISGSPSGSGMEIE